MVESRADLEVQLMQQNHCDGVLSNDWNTFLGQQISQHAAMFMSRSALENILKIKLNLEVYLKLRSESYQRARLSTSYQSTNYFCLVLIVYLYICMY